MFSPDPQAQSTANAPARNSRRRQRDSDGDTMRKPQRKRSKLSEDTYRPPRGEPSDAEIRVMNGHPKNGSREMPVREKKREPGKRGSLRMDSSTVLTKTEPYTATQLSAFPETLRSGEIDEFRASILHGTSYALALTRTHALIWDYTASFASPTPRTFTFPQPFKVNEPLPFGTLVISGGSTDIGLVVIGAATGKVTFWENVEVADGPLSFGSNKKGVEGQLSSGFHSSETFVELIDAHHAGFLLKSSSGRIAHLTIRDEQGRPYVSAHWLDAPQTRAGLFGSIKKIFRTSYEDWQLAAVKTRPSQQKGHVEVVALTCKGHMAEWDIRWDGQQLHRRDINLNSHFVLADSLRQDGDINMQQEEEFQIRDFAFLQRPISGDDSLVTQGTTRTSALLLLVAIQSRGLVRYALVEYLLFESEEQGATMSIGQILPIDAHKNQPAVDFDHSIVLLVPEPGHTAFVIFSKSIVVASLVRGSAMRGDAAADSARLFQDVLYLQMDSTCDVVGVQPEGSSGKYKKATCLVVTKRSGITRLAAEVPHAGVARLSARTKLEQAIYFGSLPTNIFDLNRRPDYPFSDDELEPAIQQVATDILTSHSEHIPPVTQSALDQLNFRSTALLNLATFVNTNYPSVSRKLKWQLLWNAEKIAAVRGVWAAHEKRVAELSGHRNKLRPILVKIVDMAHDKRYRESSPAGESKASEHDWLRRWFVLDARSIEKVLPLAYNSMFEMYKQGAKDIPKLEEWTQQSDELVFAALQTALTFRQENAPVFGLGKEPLVDGVLADVRSFEGLPEFWTSRLNVVNAVRQLTNFARVLTLKASEEAAEASDDAAIDGIISVLAVENVKLVDIACRAHTERQRWMLSREAERERNAGERWRLEFEGEIRPDLITGLAKLGQAELGMDLADRFGDVDSLVKLSLEELRFLDPNNDDQDLMPQEKKKYSEKFDQVKSKVKKYCDKFGGDWVETFHANQVQSGRYSELLDKKYGPPEALRAYLRSTKERAKLGWMNELTNEHNYPSAAEMLLRAASRLETNAWAKQVELSTAKLTSIALHSQPELVKDGAMPPRMATIDRLIDGQLAISRIQSRLYSHVKHTAYFAMDPEAGLDLVMQTFGKHYIGKNQPAHVEMLKLGFEQLLNHKTMHHTLLIDVLTLMDSVPSEVAADDISGKEFVLALQVLHASCVEDQLSEDAKRATEGLVKMIWKRCFVRDDWTGQGAKGGLADLEVKAAIRETTLGKTLTEGTLLSLWDSGPSFQLVSPSTAVGGLSDAEELNALRFRNSNEDLATSIARDNAADDKTLKRYIDDAQLENWFASARDVAKEAAMQIAEKESEDALALDCFATTVKEPMFKRVAEGDLQRLRERHLEMSREMLGANGHDGDVEEEAEGGEGGEGEQAVEEYDGDEVLETVERDFYEYGRNGFDADGDVEMA